MKYIQLFEQFINEGADYKYLVDLILNAKPPYDVYYNDSWNVVNVGGTGYDAGDLVKIFNAKTGDSSKIKSNFYYASKSQELTKKEVEKLSNGKIAVEIEGKLVKYKLK
jgi:hypothetical protein